MSSAAAGRPQNAIFLQGSIMRHVLVMTMTGAVGLMSMFVVDLADLYFLNRLNDTEITAAIGYAGIISFANLSAGLGIGIAAAALVARNLGAGNPQRASQYASSALVFAIVISSAYTLAIAFAADPLLRALGATGGVVDKARLFIWTVSPGYVMLAAAVCCSFTLRGLGDARRAMVVTLSIAILTAIADPIFIFWFGYGLQGAAIANVLAEAAGLANALFGIIAIHRFLKWPSIADLKRDLGPIWGIAFPAILTQLAAPFTMAYTTYAVSPYGNDAVAASAVIGRIVPVVFGVIFSLSGAVGPIIGQNFGAGNFARIRQTLRDGLTFAFLYTLVTAALLFLFRHQLADAFRASGAVRDFILFFCTYVAASWSFAGAQFVANAAFNNLGRPGLSTWFNWGKATLGTIPFAMVGNQYGGVKGIMAAIALGGVAFGVASVFTTFKILNRLESGTKS
jgi:putative MATE family efflux protein